MNSSAKPRTTSRKTVLAYCEGLEDSAFLKHLKALFRESRHDPWISIRGGRGGNADSVVQQAINVSAAFDYRIVVMDNDRGVREMAVARALAQKHNVFLHEHTPCMEKLLLEILGDSRLNSRVTFGSGKYKRMFEGRYFANKQRSNYEDYESVFPKSLIKTKLSVLPLLNRLYLVVRGDIDTITQTCLMIS